MRTRSQQQHNHHHDGCESYMKCVLSQRNVRQSCLKQRCLKVWPTCIFLEWSDELCENKFIGVQMCALPYCIYDSFIYKLSVELWKSK